MVSSQRLTRVLYVVCLGILASAAQLAQGQAIAVDVAGAAARGEPAAEPRWIGIEVAAAGSALKAQLGIEDRLIVRRVIEGTPAAEAGVRVHDILLTFADTELHSLDDLVGAISQNGTAESSMSVMRGGQTESIKIRPSQRNTAILDNETKPYRVTLHEWLNEPGNPSAMSLPLRILTMGPGVLAGNVDVDVAVSSLPDNLTINIRKTGSEPTSIKVQRGEESWEVTEKTRDKLPEDLRVHVDRMLGHGMSFEFDPHVKGLRLKDFRVDLDSKLEKLEDVQRMVREQANKIAPRVKETVKQVEQATEEITRDALDELRKEIAAMRSEIRQLQRENSSGKSGEED